MESRFVIAIRGIKGKSSLQAGALDVKSFQVGGSQPKLFNGSSQGEPPPRVTIREASVIRRIDGESIQVFDKLIKSEAFPSISLFEYKIEAKKKPVRVREFRFNGAMISSYSTSGTQRDDIGYSETVGLIFESVEVFEST